jgi:hypothetical protein
MMVQDGTYTAGAPNAPAIVEVERRVALRSPQVFVKPASNWTDGQCKIKGADKPIQA